MNKTKQQTNRLYKLDHSNNPNNLIEPKHTHTQK